MTDRLLNDVQQAAVDAARLVLRDVAATLKKRAVLDSQSNREAIAMLLQLELGNLPIECSAVALFDGACRLIGIERFPEGNPTSCQVPLRTLASLVLQHGAESCLLAHNHPSGICSPSGQDVRFTEGARQWLHKIDCHLVDHLVVTVDDWCSITGDWKT